MIKIIFLLIYSFSGFAASRVRHVEVVGDQVVTVKTSVGIATIIQVPDRPNSVVVGDMDSFKVEYLDQALTIKPLLNGVKSNLYIYTDWKRFNVEIVSGDKMTADYIVYLENPKIQKPSITQRLPVEWVAYKNSLKNENISLEVKRLGIFKKFVLVELFIQSSSKERIKPEWIWATQAGKMIPLHNLFLSKLDLQRGKGISGLIELSRDELDLGKPIRLELKRKRTSYLTIPKVNSWK